MKPVSDGRSLSAEDRRRIAETTRSHIHANGRNMYGCTVCPNCGSGCRFATQDVHPTEPSRVVCDDCGRSKPLVKVDADGCGYGFDEVQS